MVLPRLLNIKHQKLSKWQNFTLKIQNIQKHCNREKKRLIFF
jgi:hypothetical protein